MILHARHYATGLPVALAVEEGRIQAIEHSDEGPSRWVAPAFFDPQINGCLGISFNSPSLEQGQVRCRRLAANGSRRREPGNPAAHDDDPGHDAPRAAGGT